MARRLGFALLAVAGGLAATAVGAGVDLTWSAGAARVDITPDKPVWMAGFASRDHPAEGTLRPLWAKALAMQDGAGRRAVLVTVDLCGISRAITDRVAAAVEQRQGLARAAVMVNVSHTHCSPLVEGNVVALREFSAATLRATADYTRELERKLADVAIAALARLEPAEIAWAVDRAEFGVNRRNNKEAEVPALRATGKVRGPVDHSAPVLAVRDRSGRLLAVAVSYACHNTTLNLYQWNGDYAGFAQEEIERRHSGAIALFLQGCGGDINPLPRREVTLAQRYGNELADAADRALSQPMSPVAGPLVTALKDVPLRFQEVPSLVRLRAAEKSANESERAWAAHLLAQHARGAIPRDYAYPVQVWRLGALTWIALGGEPVVDYALRLKYADRPGVWVFGYSNDVMAYIPSERVLAEGGYEGGGAMLYFGQPSPWAPGLEAKIIETVQELKASTALAAGRPESLAK